MDVEPKEPLPLPQRLLESPILLLIAGLAVMFVIFTFWGVLEILYLPVSNLP